MNFLLPHVICGQQLVYGEFLKIFLYSKQFLRRNEIKIVEEDEKFSKFDAFIIRKNGASP